MLSPIKLAPNMDMGTLVNAINVNFNQLESENRTKIMKDENGINRILIGQNPKKTWGIYITKTGYDVIKELES